MFTPKKKNLNLETETVTELSEDQLSDIAGGTISSIPTSATTTIIRHSTVTEPTSGVGPTTERLTQ